jgi:hypothetical protein
MQHCRLDPSRAVRRTRIRRSARLTATRSRRRFVWRAAGTQHALDSAGRLVAFASTAGSVQGTNGYSDIFVLRPAGGLPTERVSTGSWARE